MLTVNGVRMSKRLATASCPKLFTGDHPLLDKATHHDGALFMAQAHYRSTLDFERGKPPREV